MLLGHPQKWARKSSLLPPRRIRLGGSLVVARSLVLVCQSATWELGYRLYQYRIGDTDLGYYSPNSSFEESVKQERW